MKRLMANTGVKLCAALLLVVSSLALVAGILGGVLLVDYGATRGDGDGFLSRVMRSTAWQEMQEAYSYYECVLEAKTNKDPAVQQQLEYYRDYFSETYTNFLFTVTDENGKELFRSAEGDGLLQADVSTHYSAATAPITVTRTFSTYEQAEAYVNRMLEEHPEINEIFGGYEWYSAYDEYDNEQIHVSMTYQEDRGQAVTVTGYIRLPPTAHDEFYYLYHGVSLLLTVREYLVVLCIALAVLVLLLLAFLLCAVGHRRDSDKIQLRWADRIPLDLYAIVLLVVGVFTCMITDSLINSAYSDTSWMLCLAAFCLCGVFCFLLALALLLSFAVRCKTGKWWRNTICYKVLHFCWRCVRFAVRKLPLYWKFGLVWAGLCLAELIALASCTYGSGAIGLWFLEKLILTPILILAVVNMRQLQQAGRQMAEGNLAYQLSLRHMLPGFRQHGEHLNSIRGGMQKAVDERMKSERMKTELITNVSHDIKTPLTSIINYVDLLQKEQLPEGSVREYVGVLDRQSRRLKKLTDDLVEASKASTGNIVAELERTDVNVLLEQVAGEYEERMEKAQLTLVMQPAQGAPAIEADGRLIWRVMENLMGNACKYAMPQTRVYFSAEQLGNKVSIWVKNISQAPLNISSDELMERFVRGDSARTSEGSGLGLSIAKSLTELQNGFFNILIDGDLFKAVLVFDSAPPAPEPEEEEPEQPELL